MKFISALSLVVLMTACNNSTTSGTAASDSTKAGSLTPASSSASSSGSGGGSDITVTLSGSKNDGTYTVHSNESTCSVGMTGEKSFGNQYSVNDKAANELSSLQMIVDNVDEAKSGTSNFNAMIGFGELFKGNSYSMDPSKGKGSGTVTLSGSGDDRTAIIEGKTEDGATIKVVLKCHQVFDPGKTQ